MPTTRRTFLLSTRAVLLSGSAVKAAPSERVNLAIIGVRGRGRSRTQNFPGLPNLQITHVCDVNEPLMGPLAKKIADIQKSTPKLVQDIRKLLQEKSLDGVIVATPDHWHALASIWACQANKHVYVEKPISHNV